MCHFRWRFWQDQMPFVWPEMKMTEINESAHMHFTKLLTVATTIALHVVRTSFRSHLRECMGSCFPPLPPGQANKQQNAFMAAKSIVEYVHVNPCYFLVHNVLQLGVNFHEMLSENTTITSKLSLRSLTKFSHSLILVVVSVHVLLTNSWCAYTVKISSVLW